MLPSRVYEQDLWRHIPRSLPSTTVSGLKTWSDSASEESKLSSFSFPKQGFRPLHFQAEHPHLPQDGYVLKYHNIYHSYIIHSSYICQSYTSSCIILCIRLAIFYQNFSCFLQSR